MKKIHLSHGSGIVQLSGRRHACHVQGPGFNPAPKQNETIFYYRGLLPICFKYFYKLKTTQNNVFIKFYSLKSITKLKKAFKYNPVNLSDTVTKYIATSKLFPKFYPLKCKTQTVLSFTLKRPKQALRNHTKFRK